MKIKCCSCPTEFDVPFEPVTPNQLRAYAWFANETAASQTARHKGKATKAQYRYTCVGCWIDASLAGLGMASR